MKKSCKKYLLPTILILLFLPLNLSRGAITSIMLTPASPTVLSDGRGYYLAGKLYTFVVKVMDPAATAWTDVTDVRVTIPNSTNIVVAVNPAGTGDQTANISSQTGPVEVPTCTVTGTYQNFIVTFGIRILWNTDESAWAAGRLIEASATATSTDTLTNAVSYGVRSSIRLLNFALGGEAADGYVNRYHASFHITGGAIVYNISGAASADAVRNYADNGDSEVSSTDLYVGAYDMGNDDDDDDAQDFTLADSAFDIAGIPNSGTAYSVFVRANMATGSVTVDTSNTLSIYCDEIEVTDIIFLNGGGVDIDPYNYYRSLLVSGTQVRIDASMLGGGGTVVGDTTVELRDTTDGSITPVTVASGSAYGIATVNTADLTTAIAATGDTTTYGYEIYNIYGGSYCSAYGFGQYRDDSSYITQPVNHSIHWENGDPPGQEDADTDPLTNPFNGTSGSIPYGVIYNGTSTSDSFRIDWVPISTYTEPAKDRDFYSYRIYYREVGAGSWIMIDTDTVTSDNRYNSGGINDLSDPTTSYAYITGLKPLTTYQYRFSAVDVFGNEVAEEDMPVSNSTINGIDQIAHAQTTAFSVTVKLTDGINTYEDTDFADDDGSPRPVYRSSITITATIMGDIMPSSVNLIAAGDGASEVNDDIRDSSVTSYTFSAKKLSGNDWEFIIPTTSPLMTLDTYIRFILEINTENGTSYVDHDSESDTADETTPWADLEWRFWVNTEQPNFQPWPTRILNNVITDKNPVAYPAYYLSSDAYVTIKVYDIKGRPVAILLDNALRKGGQNIKENGWRGRNKANRKLGIGLYYVHFKAKRRSDGKVILNQFKKVVVAR